jgi:hypothetical protein
MKKYFIYNNLIEVILTNGSVFTIYRTSDSGKVFYRNKIDTISNIKHPGVCLGIDQNGQRWFMHNHYENSKPSIVSEIVFSKGQSLFLLNEFHANSAEKIIELGLNQVLEGKPYHSVNYNCQSFINLAINNQNRSEDVEKWAGRVIVGSLLLLAIGSINK